MPADACDSCTHEQTDQQQQPGAVGRSGEQLGEVAALLRRKGAMAHTTVIAPPPDSAAAQRFLAICTALAIAERVRSAGDHALVVLDDLTCMVRCLNPWSLSLAMER